ncbi:hypothetical protein CXU13_05170 [Akkermansia muciniphila]|nr:hypothetical protein CXU13_05170 [Akkermansia muciniphila]
MKRTEQSSTALMVLPQSEEIANTNRDWEIAIVRANALHGQIAGLTNQIQTLEQKRWMTAAVLGGLLVRMKAAAQHGEWGKLFSNGNHDSHFKFSKRTGDKYVSLYREVLKRAKKLGTVDVALIESGRRDARTLEEIGKLSDADSLRQAYFDFGVVAPPKKHGFDGSGNPAGRGADEKNLDDALAAIGEDGEILTARKLRAREDYASIISQLETFLKDGLHHELPPSERSFFAGSLTDLAQQVLTEKE